MNVVKALHKLKRIITENNEYQVVILFNYYVGDLAGVFYTPSENDITYIYVGGTESHVIFPSYPNNIITFFINYNITDISIHPGNPDFLLGFNYNIKQVAALKIMDYYRKYRYNLYRKRRDSLKRELMEYCYHPKRLTF